MRRHHLARRHPRLVRNPFRPHAYQDALDDAPVAGFMLEAALDAGGTAA